MDYNRLALDRIEDILNKLGVEYRIRYGNIALKCPIHGSTKLGNATIKLDCGIFKCWSGGCHEEYGSNIYGFIKGCLSIGKAEKASDLDVIKFLLNNQFVVKPVQYNPVVNSSITYMDESKYPAVAIPSRYFMKRKDGFCPETLTKFKIGDTKTFPYNDRAIVPIRSVDGKLMGFSARSHFDKCPKCGYYHSRFQACISEDYEYANMFKKWIHSKGSQKSRTFYNIENVGATHKIAIVEGPSCVWRLYEHGITAVATLGKSVSDAQIAILHQKGIKKIMFIADNDPAGKEFKDSFVLKYHKDFSIYIPRLTKKDVTEMSSEDIKNYIVEKWNRI